MSTMEDRPDVVASSAQRITTGYGKIYVRVGVDDNGRPFEVFVDKGSSGGFFKGWCEAIGKLASTSLRAGVDPIEVAEALEEIQTDKIDHDNGDTVYSIPDAVGLAIRRVATGREGQPVRDGVDEPVDVEDVDESGGEEGPFLFEPGVGGDAP